MPTAYFQANPGVGDTRTQGTDRWMLRATWGPHCPRLINSLIRGPRKTALMRLNLAKATCPTGGSSDS